MYSLLIVQQKDGIFLYVEVITFTSYILEREERKIMKITRIIITKKLNTHVSGCG